MRPAAECRLRAPNVFVRVGVGAVPIGRACPIGKQPPPSIIVTENAADAATGAGD